jgi:NAD(P)H dehydrogenase (quinone)
VVFGRAGKQAGLGHDLGPEPAWRAGGDDPVSLHYTTFLHWGSVIVAPGYTDASIFAAGGNPYGYSHTQGAAFDNKAKAAIAHQAKRLVGMAAKLAA